MPFSTGVQPIRQWVLSFPYPLRFLFATRPAVLTQVLGIHRHRIIPNPAHQSAREPHPSRRAPMSWMQRLKRVFHIDIEHCGMCGGTLRVIACIETPELIETILTHLAARETGSINHPRAPPLHAPLTQPPASPSPALS